MIATKFPQVHCLRRTSSLKQVIQRFTRFLNISLRFSWPVMCRWNSLVSQSLPLVASWDRLTPITGPATLVDHLAGDHFHSLADMIIHLHLHLHLVSHPLLPASRYPPLHLVWRLPFLLHSSLAITHKWLKNSPRRTLMNHNQERH